MSSHELESKIRELRQLQSLIEEAEREAETIKDAIKAFMGDSEELLAGEYKGHMESSSVRQNRCCGPKEGIARCGSGFRQRNHRPPVLHRMRRLLT